MYSSTLSPWTEQNTDSHSQPNSVRLSVSMSVPYYFFIPCHRHNFLCVWGGGGGGTCRFIVMGYSFHWQGMPARICNFQYLQFCACKRKFKGTVPWDLLPVPLTPVANLQRWACKCYFNPQIVGPNLQSQICHFLRYASLQIANPWIFHYKTERMKHL